MTKLRKLQRACSLGDFFKAREVTHDIFLKLKCALVRRLRRRLRGKGPGVEEEEEVGGQ